jgi:anaphase-promoting complex subunit 2
VSSEETVVELLKLRFGEGALAASEVMLKDVVDSKRVAVAGRALPAGAGGAAAGGSAAAEEARRLLHSAAACDVLVTSAHYWPQGFASQNAPAVPAGGAPPPPPQPQPPPPGVHPTLAALFAQLAASYNALKKPRTLVPLWGLGSVEVEVALGGGAPLPFSGTVAQVSLLLAFADAGGGRAPVAALAEALRIAPGAALRLLGHWVAAGVLRVERCAGGEWQAAAAGEGGAGEGGGAGAGGGGDAGGGFAEEVAALEGGAGGGEAGEAAEAEAVWCNYVVGMLSNLGTLPVDRIHSTLKMFASMGDYPCASPRPTSPQPEAFHAPARGSYPS